VIDVLPRAAAILPLGDALSRLRNQILALAELDGTSGADLRAGGGPLTVLEAFQRLAREELVVHPNGRRLLPEPVGAEGTLLDFRKGLVPLEGRDVERAGQHAVPAS
jgi:hypothetical protein